MNLRAWMCYLLSLIRIHRPDCSRCNVQGMCWVEMKKRLDELNWNTPPPAAAEREEKAS